MKLSEFLDTLKDNVRISVYKKPYCTLPTKVFYSRNYTPIKKLLNNNIRCVTISDDVLGYTCLIIEVY